MNRASVLAALLLLGACADRAEGPGPVSESRPAPSAPAPVPAQTPAPEAAGAFPVRGEGPALPRPDQALTRIAIGSCSEETEPLPIFAAVAAARPDLFLYVGDNVYGDARAGDMQLPELRKAYDDLSVNAHFSAFNMAVPMLAVWDDHDYGLNDAGAEFPARDLSERIFETYWTTAAVGGGHPGVYGSRTFGPKGRGIFGGKGRRVQIIMLDTRFFRTPLKRGEPNPDGRRPYVAQTAADASMLGEAQWRWLEAELRKPAEVRLLVSSIQVLAEGHPYESWDKMPAERQRLFNTIKRSRAKGVVLISGDRHVAAMYRQAGLAPYPLTEMTTSSLNLNFVRSDAEWTPAQIGRVFTPANFGMVEVDWTGRKVGLSIRGMDGAPVRTLDLPFSQIGL